MATLYTHQSENIHKTWLLMTGFLVAVVALGALFSYIFQSPLILYIAIGISLAMNFYAYWYSDKLALSMSKAVVADPTKYRDLYNVVENLSITAGLPAPKIYIINDAAPNAFATGRNKNHASVAVTTGLIEILDKTELEGVIAHELSHIGNRDALVSTAAVVLVGCVALLSNIFLRLTMFGGGRSERGGNIFLVIIALIAAILAPIAAMLIQLAISRKREFLADASGALLTRYPEGLANALRKISSHSRPMQNVNPATAHLFIANPYDGATTRMARLFSTHPPIAERIKALVGDEQ